MVVNRDDKKKVAYIKPDRDLLADESRTMRREFEECLCLGVKVLVLDLARVRTIDSAGLKTIIDACSQMRKSAGKLVIENASREMTERFRMLRMSGPLTISSTVWPG
jgi:anti-anti-sigma factor